MIEESFKPVVQPERWLNLNMKVALKAEGEKLLVTGIIYPILDRAWVSYVQVVQKKGGMTVVPNEKNKLIPTRTVTS